MVGEDEGELSVAVGDELTRLDGVAVVEHGGTAAPHITQVELRTMYLLAFAHSFHYHACHLADAALGVVFHHGAHILQTAVHVALVEFAQAIDENELVAVGT